MEGYADNSKCILDYLALFQALSAQDVDEGLCRRQWQAILTREQASGEARLAPPFLRLQFRLVDRDFLLAMAALAMELDGGLRSAFRRRYALALPTIEYGLQLISPICPSGCETLAELAGENGLCGLLLAPAEPAAYSLERPLILCRTILAFLTGLAMAEIPGCTPLMEHPEPWLPLYAEEFKQVQDWYLQGTGNVLYLCAPPGSGRKTLLRRVCGTVVYADVRDLSDRSLFEQEHTLREAAALATLLGAPICAAPDSAKTAFRSLERLCRRYHIPLAVLAETDQELAGAKEVLRLPRQREGVTAVFHGPSGTGKTMAACAIAHRLGMPLLRADLSRIMDKYVGETEKHLGRLFRSARENHCVLLFDEADALFGKRAQISTGHDKYANLSTSYLLQEIEQYDGIAILSTNLLGSFDDAFLRRLHYIVCFSLPDAALRETLWRQALPPERCAEELPYAKLAQAALSPARILAAVRGAVVDILGAGREKVDAASVVNALRLELEKSNKALPKCLAESGRGERGGEYVCS